MKKILVIQTASIGDVILATPIMEKLHVFFPDAVIDILIKKGNESLFESHPYLGKIYIWNKKENKYKNWRKILRKVQNERYDLIVNIQRFFSMSLFTILSRAKNTTGFSKSPLSIFFTIRFPHHIGEKNRRYQHEAERNLSLIVHFTDHSFVRPKLYPTADQYEKVSQYKTEKYICIAPASLWFTKQLSPEKWIEFVNGLSSELRIYYLGGNADIKMCNDIISRTNSQNSVNLAGRLTLLESAALMQDAAMNYTNDSSPMHLASAVNGNTTAVFCSTIPEFGFGPLAQNSRIIQTNLDLKCRPCGLHGHKKCPEKHFNCSCTINTKEM